MTMALPKPLLELPPQLPMSAPVPAERTKPPSHQRPILDTPTSGVPASSGEVSPKTLLSPLKPHPPLIQEQEKIKVSGAVPVDTDSEHFIFLCQQEVTQPVAGNASIASS